ncbi:hypothetical protein X743_17380 [Mesorhizobium sp. LNHC252B00]|nr:hypothetical protein X743_17380 [Mesorhizobium sp. LNHC252B00]
MNGYRLERRSRRIDDGADRLGVQARQHLARDPAAGADICRHRVARRGRQGRTRRLSRCLPRRRQDHSCLSRFPWRLLLFIDRVDYRLAVAGGIAIWLVAALAIFLAPRYL